MSAECEKLLASLEGMNWPECIDAATLIRTQAKEIAKLQGVLDMASAGALHWEAKCVELRAQIEATARQEPVAWQIEHNNQGRKIVRGPYGKLPDWQLSEYETLVPLYAAPVPAGGAVSVKQDDEFQRVPNALLDQVNTRLDELERENSELEQAHGEAILKWKKLERQLATVSQEERERCAQACLKEKDLSEPLSDWAAGYRAAQLSCTAIIRALAPHAGNEPASDASSAWEFAHGMRVARPGNGREEPESAQRAITGSNGIAASGTELMSAAHRYAEERQAQEGTRNADHGDTGGSAPGSDNPPLRVPWKSPAPQKTAAVLQNWIDRADALVATWSKAQDIDEAIINMGEEIAKLREQNDNLRAMLMETSTDEENKLRAVAEAAKAFIPFWEQGWDEQDEPAEQIKAREAGDVLVAAVRALEQSASQAGQPGEDDSSEKT